MRKIALLLVAALFPVTAGAAGQFAPVSILDLRVNIQDAQETPEVGRPLSLQLNLKANEPGSLVYIFQVKDSDGYTAHIFWRAVELAAGDEQTFASSWVPKKEGRYIVEAFVWQNAPSPVALSIDVPRLILEVKPMFSVTYCMGTAECLTGKVMKIVDGDTLDVGNHRIRLALVNTPERGQPGYSEATTFTSLLCPVGSSVLVDEDDGQTSGSYGRMVAKVFCGERILNAELLHAGHAGIYAQYCSISEFADEMWARQYGCN